ncbi:MAG: type IV pilus modification PilV family protein [Minisyncoccota bacterium]
MIKINNKETSGGFTLVETLVAIGVLVLAVTGAFSAAQMGITTSTYSKNQVIAFYLAQDGVEFIRNIRDNNGLNGQFWLTGISSNSSDPCYFGNTCIIDPTAVSPSPNMVRCSGGSGSCPLLKQDSTSGIYGYVSGTDTIFRREIQLTRINDNEISILVSVIWRKGLVDRTFRVRENIFDWQTST